MQLHQAEFHENTQINFELLIYIANRKYSIHSY
mgnify:CR=1 FL=1